MTDRLGLGLNEAAAAVGDGDSLGLEGRFQVRFDGPDVATVTTGKHVDRCIAVLCPGMDREKDGIPR